jgi:aspartate racemase
MKTIGLIGGTSWVSTTEYYRLINQTISARLGGMNSAKLLLYSVNHEEFKALPSTNWDKVAIQLSAIGKTLEEAGADCLLLCANTMHRVAEKLQENIKIPLIHIAVETAKEIKIHHITRVGLLGTRVTMEQAFFKEILSAHGMVTFIPEDNDRDFIESTIFTELSKGIFRKETKEKYIALIHRLIRQGAEGIILGCTEIPLLLKQEDCPVPVFDTTAIHSKAAVEFSLFND